MMKPTPAMLCIMLNLIEGPNKFQSNCPDSYS